MKIEVNINKKYAVLIIIGVFVLAGAVLTYASGVLTPGVAPANGHTINQIAPPAGCGNGQVLSWDETSDSWDCVNLPTSTTTPSQKKSITITYTFCDNVGDNKNIQCPAGYPNEVYRTSPFYISHLSCGGGNTVGVDVTCSN